MICKIAPAIETAGNECFSKFTFYIRKSKLCLMRRREADQKQNGAKCTVRDICRAPVHGRAILNYHSNLWVNMCYSADSSPSISLFSTKIALKTCITWPKIIVSKKIQYFYKKSLKKPGNPIKWGNSLLQLKQKSCKVILAVT